jgi:hypothetical protein
LSLLAGNGTTLIDGLRTDMDLVALMPSLRLNSFELRPAFDAYLRRRGPASGGFAAALRAALLPLTR